MIKYFSVKAAAFNEAQNIESQRNLKILKAAPARCLSRGETSKHVITRFGPLVNNDREKCNTGIKSFRDTLLNSDVLLMLLLLADTLQHVNEFLMFLQNQKCCV